MAINGWKTLVKTRLFLLLLLSGTGQAQNVDGLINRLDKTAINTSELTKKISQLMDSAQVTDLGITVFNKREPVYMRPSATRTTQPKNCLSLRPFSTVLLFAKPSSHISLCSLSMKNGLIWTSRWSAT